MDVYTHPVAGAHSHTHPIRYAYPTAFADSYCAAHGHTRAANG